MYQAADSREGAPHCLATTADPGADVGEGPELPLCGKLAHSLTNSKSSVKPVHHVGPLVESGSEHLCTVAAGSAGQWVGVRAVLDVVA